MYIKSCCYKNMYSIGFTINNLFVLFFQNRLLHALLKPVKNVYVRKKKEWLWQTMPIPQQRTDGVDKYDARPQSGGRLDTEESGWQDHQRNQQVVGTRCIHFFSSQIIHSTILFIDQFTVCIGQYDTSEVCWSRNFT